MVEKGSMTRGQGAGYQARRVVVTGMGGYAADVGSSVLRNELDAAGSYKVVFEDYDWSLNNVEKDSSY